MTLAPLVGKQRTSVELATHRINLWEGSVRSSKTVSSLLAWLRFTRTGPAGNLVMVGRTERTLKRNIIDPLVDWLGSKRCRYVAGSGELWILGRRIYIAGANDERAADKIRGLTLTGAYVDEVSVIPESFFSMLLTRLSVDGAALFGTSNPDNPSHWLMRDYLKRARVHLAHDGQVLVDDTSPLDLARFSFRLADNPSLSAAYIAALGAEFTGLWRKRFIEGLWVLADGAIYDTFDPELHTGPLPVDDAGRTDVEHWIVSLDYGTVNPFHALLLGVGHDERLHVASEYRHDSRASGRQLTDAEYSTAMRAWLTGVHPRMIDRLEGIYVDPSAASFQAQLHRDGWDGVRGADNTVLDGIRDTASLLAAGQLIIDPTCTGLIDELPGYVWDPDAATKGIDKPLKVNDHACMVAGTMVATARGDVPIELVRRGDRVWTSSGWRAVLDAGRTAEMAPVFTVAMSNGRSLTATPDHPVWVDSNGWTRVDALRYGDRLSGWTASRLSMKASCFAATPTRPGGLTGSTSHLAKRIVSAACAAFTKSSGSPPMARSLRAATSTTSTSIHSTTTWRIWRVSPRRSTPKPTGSAHRNAAGRPSTWRSLTASDLWLPSGTEATRGAPGIRSTVVAPGRIGSPSPALATSAGPTSRPSSSTTRRGSAPTSARRSGDVTPASTTSSVDASVAGRLSSPTATTSVDSAAVHVLSVTAAGRADVFNLRVAGAPEFFANGVLVHNCDALRYGVRATRRWWRHWLTDELPEAA